jgi:WD40 repeat protein
LTVVEETQLITAGWDDMIVVWDLNSGAVLRRIRLGFTETFIKSISYENGQIYAGGVDQFVRRINLASGMVVKSWFYEWFISSVVVKDGFLYVGIQREVSQIEKISVSTSDVVLRFEGHTTGVYSLYYYKNLLFSGPDKDRIIAWNPETGSIVQTFSGPAERILALVVHEQVLYSAGFDNIIKWNIDDGKLIKIFPALHTNIIRSISYRNGALFSGSDDNLVIRWNSTDLTPILIYEGRRKILYSLVLWKSFVVCGGEDGIIRSWDLTVNSIDPFVSVNGHFKAVYCMTLSEDSLFSGGFDAIIRHWNLTDFSLYRTLNGTLLKCFSYCRPH